MPDSTNWENKIVFFVMQKKYILFRAIITKCRCFYSPKCGILWIFWGEYLPPTLILVTETVCVIHLAQKKKNRFINCFHYCIWTAKYVTCDRDMAIFFIRDFQFITIDAFYIQSFSLTECIGIVGVRKYLGCLSAVCASVRLSVCLSVCSRQYGETTGPITMKLSKNDPL